MKFFKTREQKSSKNTKDRLENSKNVNIVEQIKTANSKIITKIKNAKIKVNKLSNPKLTAYVKNVFATVKIGYVETKDKDTKCYGKVKAVAKPILTTAKSQTSSNFTKLKSYASNKVCLAKTNFTKFKDYSKYKLHNLSYDFGVLKDAINQTLLKTNLRLYNRAYYNYVIKQSPVKVSKSKSEKFANQIYNENIDFLLNYPQCYANAVADFNAKMMQAELKNAILKSANFAGAEIYKKERPQFQKFDASTVISGLSGAGNYTTNEQANKVSGLRSLPSAPSVSNNLTEEGNLHQTKSTELKDLEKSFLNFGNRATLNKTVVS